MSEQNNKSFLDSNTLLALVLTFIIFLGWQRYVNYKYPPQKKDAVSEVTKLEESTDQKTGEEASTPPLNLEKPLVDTPASSTRVEAKTYSVDNEVWSFKISSLGMGLEDVVVKKINKVAQNPYQFKISKNFYSTQISGKQVLFDLQQISDSHFIGTASVEGRKLTKEVTVDSELYLAKVKITVDGDTSSGFSVQQKIEAHIEDPNKVVFFLPAFDRTELYYKSTGGSDREILLTKNTSKTRQQHEAVNLTSLSDHYFSAALINRGALMPSLDYFQNKKDIDINLNYSFNSNVQTKVIEYDLFIGPKKTGLLGKISPDLPEIINFSYLGFLARPILRALNFFYSILGNYGLAVVALTLLIRLMIMPLAVSSFKSMKRMQTIQPRLKQIKEKYKDNPQVANQKTMELMKNEKVNPLGGCLPMLLQLPIFFAFYRGLSESVELYQAPFFAWIQDLSKMDPYFIFPILSMSGMVIHQLITPSSMEKMQKRMMMVMPVVFGLFFITLPSALTIYMAVSTWFGIAQHAIFLREKTA